MSVARKIFCRLTIFFAFRSVMYIKASNERRRRCETTRQANNNAKGFCHEKKLRNVLTRANGRISLTPIICAALLAWLTVAPGYNPGVPTATAHTHMSGGDPSIGSASYYRTNDYILDARSINAMGIGDDPGYWLWFWLNPQALQPPLTDMSKQGSFGSFSGGRDMHSNEQVVYDVDGYSLAYAQAGTDIDIDNPRSIRRSQEWAQLVSTENGATWGILGDWCLTGCGKKSFWHHRGRSGIRSSW